MSHIILPPEWATQEAVMLTWPHGRGDWAPYLPRVEPVFVEIAYHIADVERCVITCSDSAHETHIQQRLLARGTRMSNVAFYRHPSNDTWARDHGPITVFDGRRRRLLDFIFNGWGNKYAADQDNLITQRLHHDGAFGASTLTRVDIVLEGGSIDCDGRGSLLTTEHCLLSPQRNPTLDARQITQRLQDLLGVKQVLWLKHGYLAGDDTDSHVDTLARFCDEHTIAYMHCADPDDEHYTELTAMEQELTALRDADGAPYKLVPIPLPRAIHDADGNRLPASYVNFLIINGAVLVPTYADPQDTLVLQRLTACFPTRQVIGIDCCALIEQYGSLHCVTMQIPAETTA